MESVIHPISTTADPTVSVRLLFHPEPSDLLSNDSRKIQPSLALKSPWVGFTWNLASVPAISESGENGCVIRRATLEEAAQVLQVMKLSLSMDSDWNGSLAMAEEHLNFSVERLFIGNEPPCLVVPKGNRIIAASLLDPEPGALNIGSGPLVLMEYRNRGIGSQLLQSSLRLLHGYGLETARGITRRNSGVARHVYSKFGGVSAPAVFESPEERLKESKS
jgi:GNAT superfamily N-acetyltransferase